VAILTQVLVSRFVTIWEPATLRERTMNVSELDIAARCLDDPLAVWQATWLRCRLLTEQGRIGEAERTLAQIEELSARLARPALHWRTTWTRAGVLLAAGVVDAGEQTYREAFELGAAVGEPDVRRWYAVQRFEVLLEVDRLANLDPELVTTLDEYEAFPHFQAERATLDLHRGLSQPAAERLQQLAGGGFAGIPVDLFWLRTMTLCAHLSAALGEAGHANTLRALLVPYADVASALGGVFSGVTGYYLGLLDELVGEWDRAAETFGRAADLHRVGGAPRWHVRSELGRLRSLSHLAGISGAQISALAARVRADAGRLGMTEAAVEASTFL
jgi:hypothetical protein